MKVRSLVAAALVASAVLSSSASEARQAPIDVGEVTASNVDVDVAELRKAALAEIGELDPAKLPRRRVIVSLALTRVADRPVAVSVNATLRDAKTGLMLAIIEAGSEAQGSGSTALRRQVASAAVRSAMRRIPKALAK